MKTLQTTITVLFLAAGFTTAHAQRGQEITVTQNTPWYIDGSLVYGDEIEEFGARIGGGYDFPNILRFRLASNFTYYFTDSNVDFYTVSLYGQYSFIQNDTFDLYGIAGGIYSRNKVDVPPFGSRTNDDIGLLLGVGAEYHVMPNGSLFSDLTYNTGDFDQFVLGAGFRYFF